MADNMWSRFLEDERGFIISAELILVSTILVVGLIVGLVELQSAVVHELNDVGESIGNLNQSYSYAGTNTWKGGHIISTAGSAFYDVVDCACCDCNQGASFFCTPATAKEGFGGGFGGAVFGAPAAPVVIGTPGTVVVPQGAVTAPPSTPSGSVAPRLQSAPVAPVAPAAPQIHVVPAPGAYIAPPHVPHVIPAQPPVIQFAPQGAPVCPNCPPALQLPPGQPGKITIQ